VRHSLTDKCVIRKRGAEKESYGSNKRSLLREIFFRREKLRINPRKTQRLDPIPTKAW